ncbi:Crp/Fnr family transcriptional regulator [Winogradskyella marincola]|uniref:Crp/Fnr family transcriptional regulator n=1 Tax=Winogradskyella marincola TaxID=3037795 RepID=A0ABT6FXR4_9FLAO|nr:Crp/Fnr family transcriptional regulator [Winogradskyella sp. YYF002]MDG4714575.1 Crp/Fnr family transcriptional regulator [Winogradskyella sp. YYF002]
MQDKYQLLRQHFEEIVTLTDEEWKIIAPHFEHKKLKKHQFLIQTGQPVDCEFWIINGLIKSYAVDEKGSEHILQFAMEDYWVSDYYAFQHQIPATIFVDCIEDSEFFCLSLESREIICQKIPAMANFFRIKSNYGFIGLQQRILSLLTQTAEERYDALLFKLPKLVQRVPKKLIAAYLGVSRETLSRFKG